MPTDRSGIYKIATTNEVEVGEQFGLLDYDITCSL